jgi:hypothetical protein
LVEDQEAFQPISLRSPPPGATSESLELISTFQWGESFFEVPIIDQATIFWQSSIAIDTFVDGAGYFIPAENFNGSFVGDPLTISVTSAVDLSARGLTAYSRKSSR